MTSASSRNRPLSKIRTRNREKETSITITVRDGSRYSRHVSLPKGDSGNPLTFEEIVKKFKDHTAGVISEKRTNQIVEKVRNLDRLKTTANLVRLCHAPEGSGQKKGKAPT